MQKFPPIACRSLNLMTLLFIDADFVPERLYMAQAVSGHE
jgi:hypothetical protein